MYALLHLGCCTSLGNKYVISKHSALCEIDSCVYNIQCCHVCAEVHCVYNIQCCYASPTLSLIS